MGLNNILLRSGVKNLIAKTPKELHLLFRYAVLFASLYSEKKSSGHLNQRSGQHGSYKVRSSLCKYFLNMIFRRRQKYHKIMAFNTKINTILYFLNKLKSNFSTIDSTLVTMN